MVKYRWFGMVIGLSAFLLAIMALTSNDENQTRQIIRKAAGTLTAIGGISLFVLSILQWNSRQRDYEKGKAIREILDAEEAEMAAKNTQGQQKS